MKQKYTFAGVQCCTIVSHK